MSAGILTVIASNNLDFRKKTFSSKFLTCLAKASIFFRSSSLQSEQKGTCQPNLSARYEQLSAIEAVKGLKKILDNSPPNAVPTIGTPGDLLYLFGF